MTERVFVFVDEEQFFSVMKDLDCLYCRNPVTASKHHLKKRHLRFAIYYKDSGIGVEMTDKSTVELQATTVLLESQQTDSEDKTPGNKLACQKCGILFTTTSNLRRHERLQHSQDQQPTLCIDAKNAIYITPKDLHGPRVPIHIRKSFSLQILLCELEECWDFMKAQAQSGNPGKECRHLVRTNYARLCVPPPLLYVNSLEEMSDKQLLSTSEKQECQEMNSRACIQGVNYVYPIFGVSMTFQRGASTLLCTPTLSTNDVSLGGCMSHLTPSLATGSVSVNTEENSASTKCLSMWWLFQEHPELLQNALGVNAERVDMLEEVVMNAENVVKMSSEGDDL